MFSSPGALGLHLCGVLPPRWTGHYLEAKKCPDCNKTYKKRYDLLIHINKTHKQAKNFQCGHCDYKASVPFLLTKHIKRIHSDVPVKNHLCHDCGAMFAEKTYLDAHVKYVHRLSKIDSFCHFCGFSIKTAAGMKKHLQEMHGQSDNFVPSKDENLPHQCGSCTEAFTSIDELKKHLNAKHASTKVNDENSKRSSTVKVRYSCHFCSKIVSNKYTLEYHVNKFHQQTKVYKCSYCPEAFFDSLSVKKHEEKHRGLNVFECQDCFKLFSSKALLNRHVKTVHLKEHEFACTKCDFKTFHSDSLNTHLQQVHERKRPNKCEHCDEAYFYKRDLERHYLKAHNVVTEVTYAIVP